MALEEVLIDLQQEMKVDLELLYRRPLKKEDPRIHHHEDILQAYLKCRLRDCLPTRVLDAVDGMRIYREAEVPRKKRPDLIVARSISGVTIELPIEVKWSDNRDVYSAVSEQLGGQYLLSTGWRHGLYVVGWTGDGASHGGRKPKSTSELSDILETKATMFGNENLGFLIRSIVLDLEWGPKVLAAPANGKQSSPVKPHKKAPGKKAPPKKAPLKKAPLKKAPAKKDGSSKKKTISQ